MAVGEDSRCHNLRASSPRATAAVPTHAPSVASGPARCASLPPPRRPCRCRTSPPSAPPYLVWACAREQGQEQGRERGQALQRKPRPRRLRSSRSSRWPRWPRWVGEGSLLCCWLSHAQAGRATGVRQQRRLHTPWCRHRAAAAAERPERHVRPDPSCPACGGPPPPAPWTCRGAAWPRQALASAPAPRSARAAAFAEAVGAPSPRPARSAGWQRPCCAVSRLCGGSARCAAAGRAGSSRHCRASAARDRPGDGEMERWRGATALLHSATGPSHCTGQAAKQRQHHSLPLGPA